MVLDSMMRVQLLQREVHSSPVAVWQPVVGLLSLGGAQQDSSSDQQQQLYQGGRHLPLCLSGAHRVDLSESHPLHTPWQNIN